MKERFERIDVFNMVKQYRGAIMGICGLALLFFHDWIITVSEFPVLGYIEKMLKRYGHYGVDVFFLLSGFGMAYALKDGSVRRFYQKRFRRVYVPFAQIMVVHFFLNDISLAETLSRLTGLDLFIKGIYARMWFVPALLFLYLLYPALHRVLEKAKSDTRVLLLMMAGVTVAGIAVDPILPSIYPSVISRILPFLCGVMTGRISKKQSVNWSGWRVMGMVFALAAASWLARMAYRATGLHMIDGIFMTFFSLTFVLAFAFAFALLDKKKHVVLAPVRWGIRFLSFCGMFTMEMYAIEDIYWNIADLLDAKLTYLQTNLIGLPLVILLSYLMYKANGLLWKKLDQRAAERAAVNR